LLILKGIKNHTHTAEIAGLNSLIPNRYQWLTAPTPWSIFIYLVLFLICINRGVIWKLTRRLPYSNYSTFNSWSDCPNAAAICCAAAASPTLAPGFSSSSTAMQENDGLAKS